MCEIVELLEGCLKLLLVSVECYSFVAKISKLVENPFQNYWQESGIKIQNFYQFGSSLSIYLDLDVNWADDPTTNKKRAVVKVTVNAIDYNKWPKGVVKSLFLFGAIPRIPHVSPDQPKKHDVEIHYLQLDVNGIYQSWSQFSQNISCSQKCRFIRKRIRKLLLFS